MYFCPTMIRWTSSASRRTNPLSPLTLWLISSIWVASSILNPWIRTGFPLEDLSLYAI